MHIVMPSFRGTGERGVAALFIVSVTRGIVVLFFVRIGAVLLLQTFRFVAFYVFVELCAVFWTDYICFRL